MAYVIVAARAVHPRGGEGGKVVRTGAGIECLLTCTGALSTLPRDWRDHQPKQVRGLAGLMADLADHPCIH